MENNRMFLVEKGIFVVIRNGTKEVDFGSFEEFNKYYPELDLTGKNYVDYEPDRGLYIDNSDDSISIKDAPVEEYENVINSIDSLIENKNDPFFNLNVEQAKALKIIQIKSQETNSLFMTWPLFKQVNAALGIYGEDVKQDCIAAIQISIAKVDAKELEIASAISVSDIKML